MLLDMQEYLETKKQTNLPEKEQCAIVKPNPNDVKKVRQKLNIGLFTSL